MKKEALKKEKQTQNQIDQLNAANKNLYESINKLKSDVLEVKKISDKKQERIEELEKALAMAGDSVNLLMVMQK